MADLRFRPARDDDFPAYLRLWAELETGDPPPGLAAWRNELAPRVTFAERGGAAVGLIVVQELAELSYVRQLAVASAARRAGVGRALMRLTAERARARGVGRWCLNVKPGNAPAIALYRALGLREAHRSVALRLPWAAAEGLARSATVARPIAPADDGAVEQRFGLEAGLIADLRVRRRVLLALDEGDALVGVCAFNPAFPGAFPFRVAAPVHAGALLAAMRPHARPEHAEVQIMCEADPALVEALCAVGAARKLEIAHYRGALPPSG